MANFRTIEIEAYSAQEAQIQGPFEAYSVGANCTQAWKKAGCPTDPEALNEFMEAQLKKKTDFRPGVGLFIALKNGYKNKSTRPYKYSNVKMPSYQKWQKQYLLVDGNGKILEIVPSSKRSDAVKAAREIYLKGFDGNIDIKAIKAPTKNIVSRFEYKPSKGTQLGKYLLFGTVGSLEEE